MSADDILKHFSYFSLKKGFDISCKLSPVETICMKCQILFLDKYLPNLSSADLAKWVVKLLITTAANYILIFVVFFRANKTIQVSWIVRLIE